MAEILVIGYHGKKNFGDDIFLHVAISLLNECTGATNFLVSANDASLPSLPSHLHVKGVTRSQYRISRLMWLDIMLAGLRTKSVVFAAGSIFSVIPFGLIWVSLKLLRFLKGQQFRIIALGVSAGPYRSRVARFLSRGMFSLFTKIQLRDTQSAKDLVRLVCHEKIKVSPDIALISEYFSSSLRTSHDPGRGIFGICLHSRALERAGGCIHEFIDALIETIASFSELRTIRIIVACSDEIDGDINLGSQISEKLKSRTDKKIEIICYSGSNVRYFVDAIQECDCIITSRMHVGIAALSSGIPTIQIDYAVKVRDVFTNLHIESTLEIANADNISTIALRLFHESNDTEHRDRYSNIQKMLGSAARKARSDSQEFLRETLEGAIK